MSHFDPPAFPTLEYSPVILAFGDSLTAGYGVARSESFPARLEAGLRDRWPGATVRNAGVSGDTSGHGLARLPRVLSGLERKPDLAIVEFGANDLLRGIPIARTRANLDAILTDLARCSIPVMLAAMEAPRFLGTLARQCDAIYVDLATTHGVALAPFFPPGVLAATGLTLRDGLHPNAAALARIAEALVPRVVEVLERVGSAERVTAS